jgi:hypothetical protein
MILSDSFTPDLAAAVQRHSWDWFLDLPARLNVAAEIVDQKGEPVLPASEGRETTTLRRLLARPGHPALRGALTATLQSRTPQVIAVERLEVGCFPLVLGAAVSGALVLAREGDRSTSDLLKLGSWLISVIEAHLANRRDEENDTFDRVASLHGLLNHAVTTGSTRAVVAAFADALAVWDDIEVRGYVENLRGEFMLDVALPGSDPAAAPAVLDDEFVRSDIGLVRLPRSDAQRLDYRADEDVFMAGFGSESDERWVIAMSGRIDARDESRLALSMNMLREAVRHAAGVARARVDWAILQHLLVATDDSERAAQAALDELKRAVQGVSAALFVTTTNGMPITRIGDADALSVSSGDASHLVSTVGMDRYQMNLAVGRSHGEAFMRRDQQVVDGAAGLFASWLSGVLRRPGYIKDRRASRQRFEDVIERLAEQTARQGASASVVVMGAREARFRPELLRQWVADIRGQLRDSDLVGTLTDSEIGVLLSETTTTDAEGVVQRLRDGLRAVQKGDLPFSYGLATRSAEWPSERSLVAAAREDARRRQCA